LSAATAWVNGGVRDWEASDAFAARRFDVAIPLVAWGLAALARQGDDVLDLGRAHSVLQGAPLVRAQRDGGAAAYEVASLDLEVQGEWQPASGDRLAGGLEDAPEVGVGTVESRLHQR